MRRYTEKGRVVYDRKKHVFKLSDAVRVMQKTGLRIFQITTGFESEILDRIYDVVSDFSVGLIERTGQTGSFSGFEVKTTSTRDNTSDIQRTQSGIAFIIEGKGD